MKIFKMLFAWIFCVSLTVTLASSVAVPVPAPSSGGLASIVWGWVWSAVGVAGVAALGMMGNLASERIKLLKSETWQKVLETVRQIVATVVAKMFQTAVMDLKNATTDGKLTPEEAKAAASKALEESWKALPPLVKGVLEGAVAEPGDTAAQKTARAKEQIIAPHVEQAVLDQKPFLPIPEPIAVHSPTDRLPPISGQHTPEQDARIQAAREAARERARVRLGLSAKTTASISVGTIDAG